MIAKARRRARKPKPASAEANTYGLPRGEPIRLALRAVFAEQRREILTHLDPSFAKSGRRVLRKDQQAFGPLPDIIPPFRLGALAMSERMTPLISTYWDEAGRAWRAVHDLDPDVWQVVNPYLKSKIEQAALAFCEATNNTTSLAIADALGITRQELIAGLVDAGEALPKLVKRVNKVFDLASRWRARRIAAAEASRAVHAAQETAGREAGIVAGWEWLASSDACPLCLRIAADHRFVRAGEDFAVVGTNATYSHVRHPPAHPGCNCSMVEVLKPEYGGPSDPTWAAPLIQRGGATP